LWQAQRRRGNELSFDEAAQPKQELHLERVPFREDVVIVIEKVERLHECERMHGNKGGLLRELSLKGAKTAIIYACRP
jgi:hypothetical protein